MYFLGLLLVIATLGSAEYVVMDNYIVEIINNTLINVKATFLSPTFLDLSDRRLTNIADGAFGNLDITRLYLDHNNLENLPFFAFRSLGRSLEHLSLAYNHLHSVKYVFGGLENLQTLDISNNSISFIPYGTFHGLSSSVKIDYRNNSLDHNFKIEYPKHYESSDPFLSLCLKDGIVVSLENYGNKYNYDCEECNVKILPMISQSVQLGGLGIKGFKRGWFRLENPTATSLDLQLNDIEDLTEEILNDLPEEVTDVKLALNKIQKLENGVIDNVSLRKLDLNYNDIRIIESEALDQLEDCEILLDGNILSPEKLLSNINSDFHIVKEGMSEQYIINFG